LISETVDPTTGFAHITYADDNKGQRAARGKPAIGAEHPRSLTATGARAKTFA